MSLVQHSTAVYSSALTRRALARFTRDELRDIATQHGIKRGRDTKDTITNLIGADIQVQLYIMPPNTYPPKKEKSIGVAPLTTSAAYEFQVAEQIRALARKHGCNVPPRRVWDDTNVVELYMDCLSDQHFVEHQGGVWKP